MSRDPFTKLESHTSVSDGMPTPLSSPLFARLLRGLGAHGFMQAVQLFIRVMEVPLFLWFWGPVGYGQWLMIAALPSVLAMSDGGFTKTAQREMAMRAGKLDQQGALETFQSAWGILLILSVVVVGAMTLFLPLIPLKEWLNLTSITATSLNLTLVLLAVQVLVSFQCGLLNGGFASEGNYATGTMYQAVGHLFYFFGVALGVAWGGTVLCAAAGALAGQTVGFLVMRLALTRHGPLFRYGLRHCLAAEMRRLTAPSLVNLAFPLGEALNMQGMRLLVGMAVGPSALAIFTSLRTLCRAALQPVMSISRTIEPELSLAYGAENIDRMRFLLIRGTQGAVWLSIALCIMLGLAGPRVFEVWTRGALHFNVSAFYLLLAASFVNSIWCVSLAIPCAINKHGKIAVCFFGVYGLGTLAVSPQLMEAFGMAGAALALFLSEACMMVIALRIAGSQTQQPLLKWLSVVATPPTYYIRHPWKKWRVNSLRK